MPFTKRTRAWLLPLATLVLAATSLTPLAMGPTVAPPAGPVRAKVFLTVPEALDLAFPECDVERKTVFLTKEQQKRIRALAKVEAKTKIIYPYVALRDGKVIGTAYFDTHRVRSLKETVMVVVSPEHEIVRTEVLAFGEPLEYMPKKNWYGQFDGRRLDADLNLKRGIKNVTGATLTARAMTNAARRALAVHQTLFGDPPPHSKQTGKQAASAPRD